MPARTDTQVEDGERTRRLVPALARPASAIRRNALQIKPTGSDQGTTYRGIVGSAVDGASDGRVNLASERQATRGAAIDWVDVEGTAVIEDHETRLIGPLPSPFAKRAIMPPISRRGSTTDAALPRHVPALAAELRR